MGDERDELHAVNQLTRRDAFARGGTARGWQRSLVVERDAVVLPQTRLGAAPDLSVPGRRQLRVANGGVYDRNGVIVPSAIHSGGLRFLPDHWTGRPNGVERLHGRWLYGGLLRTHFGHVVLEGLGRLWGGEDRGDLRGIVFLLFNGASTRQGDGPGLDRLAQMAKAAGDLRFVRELIALFGGGLPLAVAGVPLEVEELVIPSQLIGFSNVEEDMGGHADFRAFVSRKVAHLRPPVGSPRRRVYVSRARLPARTVSILFEAEFEAALAEEGYDILYPETLTIAQQLATYAAANVIVAPTGSALHLAAYALDGGQRVAVIDREEYAPIRFVRQLELFGAREVVSISHPWAAIEYGQDYAGLARHAPANIVDFDAIWTDLLAAGFVTRPRRFGSLAPDRIARAVQDLSIALGQNVTILPVGSGRRPGRFKSPGVPAKARRDRET